MDWLVSTAVDNQICSTDEKNYLLLKKLGLFLVSLGNLLSALWVCFVLKFVVFTLREFVMNILTFRYGHLFCVDAKYVYSVTFLQVRYVVICVSDVTSNFWWLLCVYFASLLYFVSWCNLDIFWEYKLLMRLVCCCQGVFPDVSEVSTFHKYLEALLAFTQHPSQVVFMHSLQCLPGPVFVMLKL